MMLLVAAVLFILAALVGWVSGNQGFRGRSQQTLTPVSWLLSIAGAVLAVISGGLALASSQSPDIGAGLVGGVLRADPLTGLFLVISFGVAVPSLISALAARRAHDARIPAGIGPVLLAVLLVVAGANLFTFLFGWEGLGFAFYLVVGYDRHRPGRGRAAVMAGGFSGFSGAAVLLAGSILFAHSGTLDLAHLADGAPGWAQGTAFALFVLGFAVKIGLMPVHIWLPPSYAAAPGPARAILAGSAVNVGFYGLWRVFDMLGAPPVWLACTILVIGGLTALLGISHATVHADIASLVAWSSVENAGVILTGYGVALVGAIAGETPIIAVGLLAATAQVIAHALGKSLLFVAVAGVESAYQTTDLDRLRAVAKRLPFSGGGLVIGALTLAGLPLTAGFASEWLILESLMQQFRVHELAINLCLAVAGVLVALTVGIAGVAFVRLIALTAFGRHPETPSAERRRYERSWAHRLGVVLLVLGCLGVAVVAPLEMRVIGAGLVQIAGDATADAVTGTWILQPVYPGFSALSPSWLWIVIPGYALLTALIVWVVSGRRFSRVRYVPPWRSASPGVTDSRGHGYTSFAFANPMRRVLSALLLTKGELHEHDPGGTSEPGAPQLRYRVDVDDVVERFLYRPLLPAGRRLVSAAKRLQSGRLDAYMAYMLIAVLAVLGVVTAIAQSP